MNAYRTAQRSTSERTERHAAMLEAALGRPDIREVVGILGNWQELDRRLYTFRATRSAIESGRTVTTDRSL